MSEYIVTVPKRHLNQIQWNTTHSSTMIKPTLGLSMPESAHTHMNDTIFLVCPDSKKKKNQPTHPPNFQAKRANKPFIFRPYLYIA